MYNNNKKSFTLIELLIVLIIIGVLATLAIAQYQNVVEKSKNNEALAFMASIREAEIACKTETGQFVDILGGCSYNPGGWPNLGTGCSTSGYPTMSKMDASYVPHALCMKAIGLSDPNPNAKYWYFDGTSTTIWAIRKKSDGTIDGNNYMIMDYASGQITYVGNTK